jgi:hypothetical protein
VAPRVSPRPFVASSDQTKISSKEA